MPSNHTSFSCLDSSGLLWTCTYDGLIGYDGTQIRQYLRETHPGLASNIIGHLHCDSRNRIWMSTGEGISLLDEQRRIKKVTISDTLKKKDINGCLEVQGLGMVAFSPDKAFLLKDGNEKWEPYTWFNENVGKGFTPISLQPVNTTTYIFIKSGKVMMVDFAAKKILLSVEIPGCRSVCKINDKELLAITEEGFEMYRLSIATGAVLKKYSTLKDVNGTLINTTVFDSDVGANGIVYITTRSAGLLGFDPVTEKIYSYRHQPLNNSSISVDNLRYVICHSNGYMAVSSTTGLNFTNVLIPVLRQVNNFIDEKGNVTDNILMTGADAKGRIWVSNQTRLLMWDPATRKAKDISPPFSEVPQDRTNRDAGNIFRDSKNNMWVCYNGNGLALFNSDGKLLKFLTVERKQLTTNRVRLIRELADGRLAIGGENSFFILNTKTLETDSLDEHPLLKGLSKKRIVDILVNGDELWLASSPRGAAYCYNFKTKTLRTITPKEGLSSDRVYCLGKDNYSNIYIGTFEGLNVLAPDGKISMIDKSNGLRHARVDNIIIDAKGLMWITNFSTLICYNPANKSFTYFDEQNGVSNAGFVVGQTSIAPDGKIILCNHGLLIVDPEIPFVQKNIYPAVSVNRMYGDGSYDLLKPGETIKLKYSDAKITLYYLTNNLLTANRFFYRYKMDGLDTGWQQPVKNNQVTYNLKPGSYTFHIQTSYNEGGWNDSKTPVTIIVLPPWWQTLWFRLAAAALLAIVLFVFYRRRIKKIKDKAAIQQQITELESRALRAQMNPHFIFNSLNAIQELIVTKKLDEGYQYLSNFSKLLRQVLNNSERNLVPLSAEIEMIKLQLSLESLRFKKSFSYSIHIDENIEPEMVNVPPLLLQPYVENAVWHGLRHKDGDKNLWIRIKEKGQQLNIEIEDNGVGRQRAEEIKKQKLGAEQFESKGSVLSEQRINILANQYPGLAAVNIKDNQNKSGEATGTLVAIVLPSNLK